MKTVVESTIMDYFFVHFCICWACFQFTHSQLPPNSETTLEACIQNFPSLNNL